MSKAPISALTQYLYEKGEFEISLEGPFKLKLKLFYYELKLEVFVMTKPVSNRDI